MIAVQQAYSLIPIKGHPVGRLRLPCQILSEYFEGAGQGKCTSRQAGCAGRWRLRRRPRCGLCECSPGTAKNTMSGTARQCSWQTAPPDALLKRGRASSSTSYGRRWATSCDAPPRLFGLASSSHEAALFCRIVTSATDHRGHRGASLELSTKRMLNAADNPFQLGAFAFLSLTSNRTRRKGCLQLLSSC